MSTALLPATVHSPPAARKNDAPGYRPDWNTMTDVFEWQQVTVRTKDGAKISGRVVGNQKPLPREDAQETPALFRRYFMAFA